MQHNAQSGTPSTRVAIATCINGAWMDTEHEQLGRSAEIFQSPPQFRGSPGSGGRGGAACGVPPCRQLVGSLVSYKSLSPRRRMPEGTRMPQRAV